MIPASESKTNEAEIIENTLAKIDALGFSKIVQIINRNFPNITFSKKTGAQFTSK